MATQGQVTADPGAVAVHLSSRNLAAVFALIFTAPFVAEFLLGDLTIKAIAALVVMAPMYGGGALLIREISRRRGLGWRGILILGAAYTLIEEGFTTMSLFNPDYLKLHMHLLDHAWIPMLGIGAWWTLFMFNLHTFWSISVSVALIEGIFPEWADRPWLGRLGDAAIGALFVLGCVIGTAITLKMDPWKAPPVKLIVTTLLVLIVVLVALRRPRSSNSHQAGDVPSPWVTAAVTFVLGLGVMFIPNTWNWGAFAAMVAIDFIFLALLTVFSSRESWTKLHTLSLAAAGACAYGLHAFTQQPVYGGTGAIARISNAIFLGTALILVAVGAARTARVARHHTDSA